MKSNACVLYTLHRSLRFSVSKEMVPLHGNLGSSKLTESARDSLLQPWSGRGHGFELPYSTPHKLPSLGRKENICVGVLGRRYGVMLNQRASAEYQSAGKLGVKGAASEGSLVPLSVDPWLYYMWLWALVQTLIWYVLVGTPIKFESVGSEPGQKGPDVETNPCKNSMFTMKYA